MKITIVTGGQCTGKSTLIEMLTDSMDAIDCYDIKRGTIISDAKPDCILFQGFCVSELISILSNDTIKYRSPFTLRYKHIPVPDIFVELQSGYDEIYKLIKETGVLDRSDVIFSHIHMDGVEKRNEAGSISNKKHVGTSRLYRVYSIDGYNCLVVAENELEAKTKYNDKKSTGSFSQIVRIDLVAREYLLNDGIEQLIM